MKKIIGLLIFLPIFLFAQKPQDLIHDRSGFVDDFAGIYTLQQKSELGNIIHGFFDTVQIALVTVKSLEGNDVQELATTLFNKWGVGSKSNNGLLILIAPNEHKAFAATGRAIQADLTDLECARLQREIMVPEFKKGDYFTGTKNLLNAYIHKLSPSAKQFQKDQEAINQKHISENEQGVAWALFLVVLVVLFVAFIRKILKTRAKKVAAQKQKEENDTLSAYNTMRDKIKSFHSELLGCVDFEEYADLMAKIDFVYVVSMTTSIGRKSYITTAQSFFDDNKKAIDSIRAKKEIVDKAQNTLSKIYTDAYFDKLTTRIETIKKGLSSFVFDTKDYSGRADKLNSYLSDLKSQRDALDKTVKTKQFNNISSAMSLLDYTHESFFTIVDSLEGVIALEMRQQSDSKNGKNTIQMHMAEMQSYANRKGVSQESIDKTKQAIQQANDKLSDWDTISLIAKYALLVAIIAELSKCTFAKDECMEMDRKAREESERLAAIAEAERKKKREKEDEEERSRSSVYAAAAISSSNDTIDSGNIAGSTFGGGSTDGAGGGASW